MHYPRDLAGYGPNPPKARWPGGARVALNFVLNYEEGAENSVLHGDKASEAFLSEIVGAQALEGVRHMSMESIYEYGSRVGVWRVLELFRRYEMPLTVFGIAMAMERHPAAVEAFLEAGHEIASHGWRWINYQYVPLEVERVLYAALHATLVAALLGVRARAACLLSGLLLYHFAPFETVIRTANPYLRGFTLPCLGLLVVSFARCGDALTVEGLWRRRPAPPDSPDYRWPLALVQVLLSQVYFFAGWSKLATTGWAWLEAGNIRGHLLVLNQALTADPLASWGYALARHPALCAAVAWTGIAFELAFPLVLFSAWARRLLLPLALVFHLANSVLFRIFFQNVWLLLLFVPWSRVLGGSRPSSRRQRASAAATAAC